MSSWLSTNGSWPMMRSRRADASAADDTDGEMVKPREGGGARLPGAALGEGVEIGDMTQERERQGHGVIGDLFDAIIGHVGDRDAARPRGLDRGVVDADAGAGDDLEVGHLEHLGRDRREADEQRVGALGCHQLAHFLGGGAAEIGVDQGVAGGLDDPRLDRCVAPDAIGEEYFQG
jgi:hypothetical protein